MMRPCTVTLTSCARFDLLERTPRSLLPRLEGPREPDIRVAGTARYRLSDSGISGAFASMRFNPGLRRLADYKVVGPYGALAFAATETHVAEAYSALGCRVAHLVDPAVRHLGDGRQVGDAAKPRGLHHRLHRSLRKRILRLKWKIRPETHPVAKARNRRRGPDCDRRS